MKLIVLDRDGVINRDSADYVKSADEFIPIDGSVEAIAALSRHGWKVAIATNQSGIGRGYFGMDELLQMQQKLNRLLEPLGGRIDAFAFCPHVPDDQCQCRKPLPGMLLELIERFDVIPETVPLVGDSLRDLQAAVAVGFKPYLVKTGNGLKTLMHPDLPSHTRVFDDLASIAQELLKHE